MPPTLITKTKGNDMNPKAIFPKRYIPAGICRFRGVTKTGESRLATVVLQEMTLPRHARDHFRSLWPKDRFSRIVCEIES